MVRTNKGTRSPLGVVYEVFRRADPEQVVFVGTCRGGELDRAWRMQFSVEYPLFLLAPGNFAARVIAVGVVTRKAVPRDHVQRSVRRWLLKGCPVQNRLRDEDLFYNPRLGDDDEGLTDAAGRGFFHVRGPRSVAAMVESPAGELAAHRVYVVLRGAEPLYVGVTTADVDAVFFQTLIDRRRPLAEDVDGYTLRVLGSTSGRAEAVRLAHAYGDLLRPVFSSKWTTHPAVAVDVVVPDACEACGARSASGSVHGHRLCGDCATVFTKFAPPARSAVTEDEDDDRVRLYTLYVIRDACTGEAIYCGSTSNLVERARAHLREDVLADEDPDMYTIIPVHTMRCTFRQCLDAEQALSEALAAAGEPLRNFRFGSAHTATSCARIARAATVGPGIHREVRRRCRPRDPEKAAERLKKQRATTLRRSPDVYRHVPTGELFANTRLIAARFGGEPDMYYSRARSEACGDWEVVPKETLTLDQITTLDEQIAKQVGVPVDVQEHFNARQRRRPRVRVDHVVLDADSGTAWPWVGAAAADRGLEEQQVYQATRQSGVHFGGRWCFVDASGWPRSIVDCLKAGQQVQAPTGVARAVLTAKEGRLAATKARVRRCVEVLEFRGTVVKGQHNVYVLRRRSDDAPVHVGRFTRTWRLREWLCGANGVLPVEADPADYVVDVVGAYVDRDRALRAVRELEEEVKR